MKWKICQKLNNIRENGPCFSIVEEIHSIRCAKYANLGIKELARGHSTSFMMFTTYVLIVPVNFQQLCNTFAQVYVLWICIIQLGASVIFKFLAASSNSTQKFKITNNFIVCKSMDMYKLLIWSGMNVQCRMRNMDFT